MDFKTKKPVGGSGTLPPQTLPPATNPPTTQPPPPTTVPPGETVELFQWYLSSLEVFHIFFSGGWGGGRKYTG